MQVKKGEITVDYKQAIEALDHYFVGGGMKHSDALRIAKLLKETKEKAEKVESERDAAVKDIPDILTSIDDIRERLGVDNADADNELSELCAGYCENAGPMCYKRGESCKCENFKWRGENGQQKKVAPEEVLEAIDGLIEFARERMSITDWMYYVNVIGPWRGDKEE